MNRTDEVTAHWRAWATLVAVSVWAVAACGAPDAEPHTLPSPAQVQSTQFAPAPPPITAEVPTAAQLTVLFDAAQNYSIREEQRAHLISSNTDRNNDENSEDHLQLAQAWGARPNPQRIDFTTVDPTGPDSVAASGHGWFGDVGPYPLGPIPFVRTDTQWTLSRDYVCAVLGVAGDDDACT